MSQMGIILTLLPCRVPSNSSFPEPLHHLAYPWAEGSVQALPTCFGRYLGRSIPQQLLAQYYSTTAILGYFPTSRSSSAYLNGTKGKPVLLDKMLSLPTAWCLISGLAASPITPLLTHLTFCFQQSWAGGRETWLTNNIHFLLMWKLFKWSMLM